MMNQSAKLNILLAFLLKTVEAGVGHKQTIDAVCYSPRQIICAKTTSPPRLDADLSEWKLVKGIETGVYKDGGEVEYSGGQVSYKCLYDDDNIYFAFEVPGDFRFDAEDNHLNAAVGVMFKVGEKASFLDTTSCPFTSCGDGEAEMCNDYLIDLGALRTAGEGMMKTMVIGAGDDTVSIEKGGESSYCSFDDDEGAGSTWDGAYSHVALDESKDGEVGAKGTYFFELSRSLRTASEDSDAQLDEGENYGFGVAYWDPFESETSGWSDSGHYLTGCGSEWIDLELREGMTYVLEVPSPTTTPVDFPIIIGGDATESTEENTGSVANERSAGSSTTWRMLTSVGLFMTITLMKLF